MASFTVTPSELRRTAEVLRESNQKFKTQVGELENAESNLNTQWEGDDKDVFHNQFMKDKAYMEAFYKEIEKYCATLEQEAAEYEKAEAANVELVNSRKH